MNYIEQVRSIAKNNKYTKWYCNIVQNAQLRATSKKEAMVIGIEYTEEHHILPKSFKMGGEKDKANYAYLTAREHLLCHMRLLPKMFDGVLKQKMCCAAFAMIRLQKKAGGISLSIKQLAVIKQIYAEGKKIGAVYARKNKKKLRIYQADGSYTMSQEVIDGHIERQSTKIKNGTHNMLTPEFKAASKAAEPNRLKVISRRVVIDGVVYGSAREAYRLLKTIKYQTLIKRIENKKFPTYFWEDERGLKEKIESTLRKGVCGVIVDGVQYHSVTIASKELGLTYASIWARSKSDKFPNYQLIR